MEDVFIKMPLSVLGFAEFNPVDKIVYSYFLQRVGYFCWERKGEYFDNQEDIAEVLGIGIQVVRRSIGKLIATGILKARKERYQGRWKWIYTDITSPENLKARIQ